MSAGETVPLDRWAPPAGAYAPPIQVGAPRAEDGERWFRVADLGDLRTGKLDGIIGDLASTRGYRDGKSQGGGLALFFAGAANGVVLRAVGGWPIPELRPDETWVEMTARGNLPAVRVERPTFLEPTLTALRANLHNLLDPIFAALHERTRFPVVRQWAQLASSVASMLLEPATMPQPAALAFLDELFTADDIMRRARPHVTWVEWNGGQRAFATRRVCCFNYRGLGGEYCSSQCPMVAPAERAAAAARAFSH